ncbi:hypothetical protein D3C80_1682100 [compost metagenome]
MAATEAGTRLLASSARLTAASLVGLTQHLVDEGLSALLRFPRLGTKALLVVLIAFLAHPEKSPNRSLWSVVGTPLSQSFRADNARPAPDRISVVPHPTHVQTAFERHEVLRPFILPSAFSLLWRSWSR